MQRFPALVCVGIFAFARFASASVPGFEDAAVLQKVMNGDLVVQDMKVTKKEFHTVFRMFIPKASTDAWVEVATNHAKYPTYMPDVKSAETLKANADRTEFEFKMDVVVKIGIFSQHIFPETRQVVRRAADTLGEALVTNTVFNYTDMIASNTELVRAIPYQGGLLILDDVQFVLVKENNQSTLINNKLKEVARGVLEGFRTALTR